MEETVLKVDRKGRLHIPKNVRDKLGIDGEVKATLKDGSMTIEPASDLLEKLGREVKFNFKSVEDALPALRKSAEKQLKKEMAR